MKHSLLLVCLALTLAASITAESQKHIDFVSEQMGDKPVTDLPGVGGTYGKRLEGQGYAEAYTVFGQYLVLHKSQDLFVEWFREITNGSQEKAEECFACLDEYAANYL